MFATYLCLLMLLTTVLAEGTPSPVRTSDTVPNGAPNKPLERARAHWPYHSQDDSYRQPTEGISHGATNRGTESHSDHPNYSGTSVTEYWRANAANFTTGNTNGYTYSRPYAHSPLTSFNSPPHLKDTRGSFYYQTRPLKKNYPHYVFNKVSMQHVDGSKYKKTVPHQSSTIPLAYKKPLHPRIHKPYAKHKYPTQKTVHPLYRRYYQSQYQRYSIPASEMKLGQNEYSHSHSHSHSHYASASTASSEGRETTERMDDGSAHSEDYIRSNSSADYYESHEEGERAASEDSASYDETTTRGYYGDRIYMSTHLPLTAPEKPATKNSYYIIRRTSDDDEDIETIFE